MNGFVEVYDLEYFTHNFEDCVHIIPAGKTQPNHDPSDHCWCEPYISHDYRAEDGKIVFTHRTVH